jgi:DNA-binding MarR family transcriptional regulator
VIRLARRLRQLDVAAEGVTISQLSALSVVAAQGPLTLGDLAEAERVQPPSMTRIVARLDEQGLVRRTTRPGDRRVSLVEVTDAGLRMLEASRTRRTAYLVERLAGLGPQDRATLDRAAVLLEQLLGEAG